MSWIASTLLAGSRGRSARLLANSSVLLLIVLAHQRAVADVNLSVECNATASAAVATVGSVVLGSLNGSPDFVRDGDPATALHFEPNASFGAYQGTMTLDFGGALSAVNRIEILHANPGTGSGNWEVSALVAGAWQSVLGGAGNFAVTTDGTSVSLSNVAAIRVSVSGGAGNLTASDYFLYELQVMGPGQVGTCPVCGDGVVDATEQCDDGNAATGDGCDLACNLECSGPLTSVTLQNPGFEAFDLQDGYYSQQVSPTQGMRVYSTDPIPGWSLTTSGSQCEGTFDPTTQHYPTDVPEGENVAFLNACNASGTWISQTSPAIHTADATYRLRVDVGQRTTSALDYWIELRANAWNGPVLARAINPVVPGAAAFAPATLVYRGYDGAQGLGGDIVVMLRNRSSTTQVNFDHVRMSQCSAGMASVEPGEVVYVVHYEGGSPSASAGSIAVHDSAAPHTRRLLASNLTVNGAIALDGLTSTIYAGSYELANSDLLAFDATTLARMPSLDITGLTHSGNFSQAVASDRRLLFHFDTENTDLLAISLEASPGFSYGEIVAGLNDPPFVATGHSDIGDMIAVDAIGGQLFLTGGDGGPIVAIDISGLSNDGGAFGAVSNTGQQSRSLLPTSSSGGGLTVDEYGRRVFTIHQTGVVRVFAADAPWDTIVDIPVPGMSTNDTGIYYDPNHDRLYVGGAINGDSFEVVDVATGIASTVTSTTSTHPGISFVPEPGVLRALATGIAALACLARRRRRLGTGGRLGGPDSSPDT